MKFHFLALAMLARITSGASGGVYARASDEQSTSTQSSLRGMFLNEDEASASASMRELRRGDDHGKDCIRVLVIVIVICYV